MSVREKFTDDEWFFLMCTPSLVGAAMSGAERSGVIGTVKEAIASMKSVMAGATRYPDNELITALLSPGENRDDAKSQAADFQKRAVEKLKAAGITTPQQLCDQAVEDCRAAVALLQGKCADTDIDEYRSWLLEVAEKVGEAAKEGGFLGFGGEQVSEGERALHKRLKSALGLDQAD